MVVNVSQKMFILVLLYIFWATIHFFLLFFALGLKQPIICYFECSKYVSNFEFIDEVNKINVVVL